MSEDWLIDLAQPNPAGRLVAYTPAAETQRTADGVAGSAAATTSTTQQANYQTMRTNLVNNMQAALDLAAAIDANTATPAQQRQALALCLRGTVRLARIVFELWDQAP